MSEHEQELSGDWNVSLGEGARNGAHVRAFKSFKCFVSLEARGFNYSIASSGFRQPRPHNKAAYIRTCREGGLTRKG